MQPARRSPIAVLWLGALVTLLVAGGPTWSDAASAEEVPAINLTIDIADGDYPLYRSTLFPPIALDQSGGSAGPWPATAKASITRECWNGPCEPNRPYTVTESVQFTGSYDPATETLTGRVEHTQQTHLDEVRLDAGAGQLEALATVVTTGELEVTWSDTERRFTGTMEGTEEATSTYWDYEPGPGWKGRHPETQVSTRPVVWVVLSDVLESPLAQTTTASEPGGTAAEESDDDATTDDVPSSEPVESQTSSAPSSQPDDAAAPTYSPDSAAAPGDSSGGGVNPAAVAVIAAGILALAGAGTLAIRQRSRRAASDPSSPPPPPAPAPPPPPVPVPALPEPSAVEPEQAEKRAGELSGAELARLEGIRAEMQAEIAVQIEAYQRARRERAVLTRLLKKNLLKVLMKQTLETQKWISLDPKKLLGNLGEKVLPDSLKVMDRIFEKHDASNDTTIIREMKAEADRLQGAMNEHIANVRHLRQEISKINQTLRTGG